MGALGCILSVFITLSLLNRQQRAVFRKSDAVRVVCIHFSGNPLVTDEDAVRESLYGGVPGSQSTTQYPGS
jgi:hypothetical protein